MSGLPSAIRGIAAEAVVRDALCALNAETAITDNSKPTATLGIRIRYLSRAIRDGSFDPSDNDVYSRLNTPFHARPRSMTNVGSTDVIATPISTGIPGLDELLIGGSPPTGCT
jgi:hypothetical protein